MELPGLFIKRGKLYQLYTLSIILVEVLRGYR